MSVARSHGQWALPAKTVFFGVAVAYAVGAWGASVAVSSSGMQAVFFAPAGLTVAVMLRLPTRQWWIVVLAAFGSEFVVDVIRNSWPVATIGGFALANAVEPLLGATLTRRWSSTVDLARRRDAVAFWVGAVVCGPTVGALIGS